MSRGLLQHMPTLFPSPPSPLSIDLACHDIVSVMQGLKRQRAALQTKRAQILMKEQEAATPTEVLPRLATVCVEPKKRKAEAELPTAPNDKLARRYVSRMPMHV
ncbi:hypothetical protein SDRG_04645 [Saprolegnia diclina VS20]|uniref:Uncharacterized protein n=1 Tax=Saprolegnia diclina (strain VS20) TaxID=1156394 RepID=T0S024_SAPDV|nr:hypothetical protein SDRG_04645 [Saprolegnia diclina VS20]EQC38218.1 hypothetical protein SDRG_04645 [Saprolegnia diclina VS20]|eukprot:XP_008608545.1 hypothetical protein SDRG_04645 [Saprolegnia diclina VS20]